jgi:hypothetical protein
MKLDGKTLADWLQSQPPDKLPARNFNYRANYVALASNLEPLHKEVTPTANRMDGGYLTDHGPDHVRKLISRISDLLTAGEGEITAYEAYILLCAAQFHDVGNIFGRHRHEEKCREIMETHAALLPPDTVEKRLIYNIARSHGGERKDKLSDLQRSDELASQTVRPQMLAALLKFADELAEDSERAARYSAEHSLLPKGSEVYHEYALALQNVSVDGPSREVRFKFDIPVSKALRMFSETSAEGENGVYLLDEILARTLKTHCERLYCSRFMRSVVDITTVSVQITITDDRGYDVQETISYKLSEVGYPEFKGLDIYALCSDLARWRGNGKLDGEALKTRLEAAHAK